jgi:hypothetical protein
MNPQEILPTPEVENKPDALDSTEGASEAASTIKTEQKSGSASGHTALSAVAVDDANTNLQGVMSSAVGSATVASLAQLDVPEVADDLDLIEKEWVKKAKEIVNATQGDPYSQNNQINQMKVDYIKKRYNKEIKIRKE